MKFFFLIFAIFIQIPNAIALDEFFYECSNYTQLPMSPKVNRMQEAADQISCMATKKAYKCDQVRQDLEDSDKYKVIQCDRDSLAANSKGNVDIAGCVWNGIKLSAESIADLAGSIVKHMNCADDVAKKRELIKAFNMTIGDDRFKVEELKLGRWLEEAGCAEVDKLLSSKYQNYQNSLMRDRITAINTGKKPQGLPDEQKKMTTNGPGIMDLLKEAMNKAGVTYQCYTPKVKAEMFCTGVTTLLTDGVLGGGVLMAAKKISLLVKSKNALARIEKAAEAGEKADLKDSSLLLKGDRVKAGESVIKRKLRVVDGVEVEKNAISEAHEIGIKEGRGFYTYTQDDIAKKARILRDAGFSPTEVRALMENGVTGIFRNDPFFRNAMVKHFEKTLAVEVTATQQEALIALHEIGVSTVKNYTEKATTLLKEAKFSDAQIKKILDAKIADERRTTTSIATAEAEKKIVAAAPTQPKPSSIPAPSTVVRPPVEAPKPPPAVAPAPVAAKVEDSLGRKAVLNNFKDDDYLNIKHTDIPENLTGEALEAKKEARQANARQIVEKIEKKERRNFNPQTTIIDSGKGVTRSRKALADAEEQMAKLPKVGSDMRKKELQDKIDRNSTSLEMYQKRCKAVLELYREAYGFSLSQFMKQYEKDYDNHCK